MLDTPDTITVNRALPLVGGANVPTPPAGFRQSEGDVKRSLSKVAETQRAEVLAALGEAAAKGPKLQADLGPYAPPAAKGEALLQRAVVLRDGKQRALDLLAYYEELEDINNHDVMNYLGEVRGELLHVADRNPLLKREYSALMSLIIQRREIILEGRARARSNQPESTPPTEGKGK
ncbi:MAG TPA: hypothetical protein VH877_26965 [Polyangia bacterium]|nr:hypothetical protein [Polyangia bacterium]